MLKSLLSTVRNSFLLNRFLPLNAGVQYFLNKSFITRLIWFLLVILALAGSANFARKIFTSWQVVFVLGLLLLLLSQLTTLFLAALAALGLPWSLTVHLHLQQKDNDKDKDKYKDNDNDKYI